MGVEQSTLSRKILKLEHVVGAKIFNRSRAGVTLTFVGNQFILAARPIVANADNLVTMMRAAGQGRAGGLRLGHNSSVSAGNLRATMMSWRERYPDVLVRCVEANRSSLLAHLGKGEIDIAILMGTNSYGGLRGQQFWSERMLVALPTAHALSSADMVHWIDLRNESFLLSNTDPGPELRDMLFGRLSALGNKLDVELVQCSRETVLSILGGGSSVSLICEAATGARYPDVVYRPIDGEQGPALISYSGYWRDDNRNPALRRFLAFIKTRYALAFDISANLIE